MQTIKICVHSTFIWYYRCVDSSLTSLISVAVHNKLKQSIYNLKCACAERERERVGRVYYEGYELIVGTNIQHKVIIKLGPV